MNETESSAPAAEVTPESAPSPKKVISRQRAAAIHLLISAVIFSGVIVPLLIMWYPPPLFFADGGWEVVKIAFGVDIVIGPLLTLLVFKSGKKGLKFDLSAIALMQFGALAWGVHLMQQQHPLFLAFAEDRFGTVTRAQVGESKRPLDELLKLGDDRPVRVLVKLPDDEKEAMKVKMARLGEAKSIFSLADRYEALTPANYQYVYGQSMQMDAFLEKRPQYREAYDAFMRKAGTDAGNLAFFPLMCRYNSVILVLRRSDNAIAGSLDIPPPDYALFTKSWSQRKSGEK